MTNKTPGEVLFQAMTVALRWRPMSWEQLPDERRDDMEKVAELTVQSAIGLLDQVAVEDMARVRDIRAIIASYGSNLAKVMGEWVYMDANEALQAIEDLLASPTPEEAGACAENAAAEQSKSPPPAKR